MVVRERISTGENNIMELQDFLFWSLDGARQTYECDLPENEPRWEDLSDEYKMLALAHELKTQKGEFELVNREDLFRVFRRSEEFRSADVVSFIDINGEEIDADDSEALDSMIVVDAFGDDKHTEIMLK